jgi:hypothetical protein
MLFGVLFCIPFIRVSAEKVWEENFEIGPYDDWTLAGYKLQNGSSIQQTTPQVLRMAD